jgi:hypothetical protein
MSTALNVGPVFDKGCRVLRTAPSAGILIHDRASPPANTESGYIAPCLLLFLRAGWSDSTTYSRMLTAEGWWMEPRVQCRSCSPVAEARQGACGCSPARQDQSHRGDGVRDEDSWLPRRSGWRPGLLIRWSFVLYCTPEGQWWESAPSAISPRSARHPLSPNPLSRRESDGVSGLRPTMPLSVKREADAGCGCGCDRMLRWITPRHSAEAGD